MTGAILLATRPAMIIRSDCRGEPRNTSAPKREISNRDADIDIISIAQQARPKDIGQIEFLRPQLITQSTEVRMMPSRAASRSIVSLSRRSNNVCRTRGHRCFQFCHGVLLYFLMFRGGRRIAVSRRISRIALRSAGDSRV